MKFRNIFFVIVIILLGLPALVLAQSSTRATKSSTHPTFNNDNIVAALGKMKLQDLRKTVPRGTLTSIRPSTGSRLDRVKAVTRFTEPGGGVAYYFNRAGILVSAQAKATKPISKETLLRQVKGLKFKKYPPQQMAAAFVRRSPNVIQGFYLDKDGRYIVITSYDYIPR